MKNFKRTIPVITAGFAIFSMFFGAGNLIFPPFLGYKAGANTFFGLVGLGISGIALVILGMIAMILFDGDYKSFFNRLGVIPGFLTSALIFSLLGPFTVLPRAIRVGFSILNQHIPTLVLPNFSLLFLCMTYFIARQRHQVIRSLGLVISPILFVSLLYIIVNGIYGHSFATVTDLDRMRAFMDGVKEGYGTMDLMAALHFAPLAIAHLRESNAGLQTNRFSLAYLCLQASFIAGALLSITYAGLGYIGSMYGPECYTGDLAEMFSSIVFIIVGKHAAFLLDLTVLMAILSTSVTLAAIFAEFLADDIFSQRITYNTALIATLLMSFFYSNFGLNTIIQLAQPLLEICYPPLIILVLCNILYKLCSFKPVKVPVLIAFVLSLFLRWYY